MDKPREETDAWFFPKGYPWFDVDDLFALCTGMGLGYVYGLFGFWVALAATAAAVYIKEHKRE